MFTETPFPHNTNHAEEEIQDNTHNHFLRHPFNDAEGYKYSCVSAISCTTDYSSKDNLIEKYFFIVAAFSSLCH